jgi:hypothetical protein
MGHLSFLIRRLIAPSRMVCIDLSPAFAYSTRRFFLPDLPAGMPIAHDMNRPLPLGAGLFRAVFCLDAFHYVQNRVGLAREFMRVIRDDGIVVLGHVHNRLVPSNYPGHPLSPDEYTQLFDGHPVRILPENYVLQCSLSNRPVDLRRTFDAGEVNSARVLYVVAAKSVDALCEIAPVGEAFIGAARNPRLNGMYRARCGGDGVVLTLDVPDQLRAEYDEHGGVLPRTLRVTAESLGGVGNGSLSREQCDLLANHVLIDLPDDY